MRYTGDLGCKYRGIPHDMQVLHENKNAKWERCKICRMRKRYNKIHRGKIKNTEYLKDHVRNFAQRFGATKAVYNKVYYPDKCKIIL
jgi:hypothetical protein